jgi:hypothetical protein
MGFLDCTIFGARASRVAFPPRHRTLDGLVERGLGPFVLRCQQISNPA